MEVEQSDARCSQESWLNINILDFCIFGEKDNFLQKTWKVISSF